MNPYTLYGKCITTLFPPIGKKQHIQWTVSSTRVGACSGRVCGLVVSVKPSLIPLLFFIRCAINVWLTPADKNEPADLGLVREHGYGEDQLQVQALIEQPHYAREDNVVEQGEEQFAFPMLQGDRNVIMYVADSANLTNMALYLHKWDRDRSGEVTYIRTTI